MLSPWSAAVLLAALLVQSCATSAHDVIEDRMPASVEDGDRLGLVVVYGETDEPETLDVPEIEEIIAAHYAYIPVTISWDYDGPGSRNHFFTKRNSGEYRQDLEYWDYLRMKNFAYSERDIEVIQAFDLEATPTYVIVDDCKIIAELLGPEDDDDRDVRRLRKFLERHVVLQ